MAEHWGNSEGRARNAAICDLRRQGKTFKEIAAVHSISPARVHQIWAKSERRKAKGLEGL